MNNDFLVFDHVTKRFGAMTAVNDVSLAVSRGEFFSLLGPSGCGKTDWQVLFGNGYMNISRFHLHLTTEDISKLVLRYAKDKIDSVVLDDGPLTIRGHRDGSKKFTVQISVRVISNQIKITVEDADVDGVLWGFQEYGVSMMIDSALKHIPGAKSGGRTESILP